MAAKRLSSTSAVILASIALSIAPACADDKPDAYVYWGGIDAAPEALYVGSGIIASLNRDLGKDGFLLRSGGGLATYHYADPSVTGGKVNGNLWQIDIMLGYQVVRDSVTLALYGGFDYQDAQLTPDDPTSEVRGTETGGKVVGTAYVGGENLPYEIFALAQYSSAFATYYGQLRPGIRLFDKLFVGPEGIAIGARGYDAQRVGGFVKFTFDLTEHVPLGVTLSGGHQFVSDSDDGGGTLAGPAGGEGTYGAINFVSVF